MKASPSKKPLIFYGVAAFMAVLTLVSFLSALAWINKPFAGFLVYTYPHVGSMGAKDWTGYRAGLKKDDLIIEMQGRAIHNGREVVLQAAKLTPDSPVNYLVKSEGKTRRVTVPTSIFSLWDFLVVFLLPFIGGLALYILGAVARVLKPNLPASRVFLFLCFTLGTYMVTGFEIQSSYIFVTFHYVINAFFNATFLHLALIFPVRKAILSRFPAVEYLIYLPNAILAAAYLVMVGAYEPIMDYSYATWIGFHKSVYAADLWITLFDVAAMVFLLVHSLYAASPGIARQRAKTILCGAVIGFLLPIIIIAISYYAQFNLPRNFLVLLVIFFPASIAYSIIKHNLFDADAIIRRTVGYMVVSILVLGAYAAVALLISLVTEPYENEQFRAYPVLFTLSVILVFNPLRNRVQALVDKMFFRKDYNPNDIIEKIGAAITSLLDRDQILKRLVQTLAEDMFIASSSVMLLNPHGTEYQIHPVNGDYPDMAPRVSVKSEEPLGRVLENSQKEFTKYDILEDPSYETVSAECAQKFDDLHAFMMVPLVFQRRVTGLLILGEKKSGKAYNREDIELLRLLAREGAVAIENARLYQEVVSLNKAMNRTLHHLSHELKTPHAVLTSSLRLLGEKLSAVPVEKWRPIMERAWRSLDRIIQMQYQVNDIIRKADFKEYYLISGMLDQCADALEVLAAETIGDSGIVEPIRKRIEELFGPKESFAQHIHLEEFIADLIEKIRPQFAHRQLQLLVEMEKPPPIDIPPEAAEKILTGLIKNAVENTPDEGRITIGLKMNGGAVELFVRDDGVGITPEHQKRIFEGFFPTQETNAYSSKKPFYFNAGGKGMDLLRIKIFSERFGFDINLVSERCRFIPLAGDGCPGRISLCVFCRQPEDCFQSGGSTFTLVFPVVHRETA
jgi:signal transduction histidine kinase